MRTPCSRGFFVPPTPAPSFQAVSLPESIVAPCVCQTCACTTETQDLKLTEKMLVAHPASAARPAAAGTASAALPNNSDTFNALQACGAFGAETSMPASYAFTRTADERKDLPEDLWAPLLRRLVQALTGSSEAPLTASAVARVLSKLGCSLDDARLQLSGQTRGAGAYTRLLEASLRLLEWFAAGEPDAIALAPAQGLLALPEGALAAPGTMQKLAKVRARLLSHTAEPLAAAGAEVAALLEQRKREEALLLRMPEAFAELRRRGWRTTYRACDAPAPADRPALCALCANCGPARVQCRACKT